MLQTKDPTLGSASVSRPRLATEQVHAHNGAAHAHEEHERPGHEHGHIESSDLIRIAVTAVLATLVWFRVWEPFSRISLLGIAGVLYGGYPIFHEAFENMRERRMTMELSMTIALVAALCIGEFFTALIIAVFVLVAEVLEGLTVSRGRRAIGDLLDLLPRSALVVKDGTTIEVPVGELHSRETEC